MATQRRRKKHKGTQAGSVRPNRRARPRNRAQARQTSEQRRQEKQNQPPTWTGAIGRGALAAGALFALLVLLLDAPIGGAIGLALLAAAIYTPAFHLIDGFAYRRRMRKREEEAGR
jgi:Flp pilus assembly protein TadB